MPFCPKCRDEFQDQLEVCPDCGVELIDKLPGEVILKSLPVKLVTVADYQFSILAHLGKAKLHSRGIRSFVFDEHIINANWFYLIAIGGVKLKVREEDAEKASQILREVKVGNPRIAKFARKCPICQSLNVHYEVFNIRITYLIMAITALNGPDFALFFPFFKRKWKCKNCGYEWK
jgi:hypothetical protein